MTKFDMSEKWFTQLEATQFEKEDTDDLSKILSRYNRKKYTVIYKVSLETARSLQILNKIPLISTIFLHDPWMNKENFQLFSQHLTDTSLLKNKKKLQILQSEVQFNQMLTNASNYSFFLDLTYQRHSLLCDFNNFRHRLKQDLKEISQSLLYGTLVCGNRAHYPYVKESLSRFSKENNISIEIQGNFWFFTKESTSHILKTKNLVKAILPKEVKTKTYTGRVAVRQSGDFCINTEVRTIDSVSHKHCKNLPCSNDYFYLQTKQKEEQRLSFALKAEISTLTKE